MLSYVVSKIVFSMLKYIIQNTIYIYVKYNKNGAGHSSFKFDLWQGNQFAKILFNKMASLINSKHFNL